MFKVPSTHTSHIFCRPVSEEAQLKIITIPHEIIIKKLTELLPRLKDYENILDISNFLLRLNTNNSIAKAIEYLFYLVRNNPKSEVTLKAMSIIGWHRDTIVNNHYLTRIFVEFIFSLDLNALFDLFDETNSKRLLELISSLEGNNEAIQLFTETFIQNPKFLINTLESFIHFGYGTGPIKERPKGTFLDNLQKFEKIGKIPNYSTRIELEDIYDDEGNDIIFDFKIYCFKVRELIDFIILSITLPEEIDFKRYIDASKYIGTLKEVLNMVNNVAGIFGKDFEIDYGNLESKDLFKITVKKLSQSINNEIYRDRHIDFTLCYEALWFCAQNMSYIEFHRAWHSQINVVKYLENQLIDCESIQKELDHNTDHPEIRCLVVDIRQLEQESDPNVIAKKLTNKIFNSIGRRIPVVQDVSCLERELVNLKFELGFEKLAIALYGKSVNEAITQLCQSLAPIQTRLFTGEQTSEQLTNEVKAWLRRINLEYN